MVQGKTIVIGSVLAAGGTIGAIALYLMFKGQIQMPSLGAGANVSNYGTGGMTDQQACAAKNWVWEAGQCKQPKSTNDDKLPDEPIDTPKVQCCTGGGMVTNPKYCPGGTAEPNCPQQEVTCPDYWSRGTPPVFTQNVKIGAGQSCPGQDCGFSSSYTSNYGKVYGSGGFCPGTDLAYLTEITQQQGNLSTGHGEHLLDPGSCPGSISRAKGANGLPAVRVRGPVCLKVTQENRSVSKNLAGQISCGSYGAATPSYVCIAPGQSRDFRPQTASDSRLSRLRITMVQPGSCNCPSTE